MRDTRREFLTGIAGAGVSGLLATRLAADDKKDGGGAGQDPRNKPSMSMVVETVFTDGIAQMSYLVGDRATGKAAVIDPTRDVEQYVELAKKHKLTITTSTPTSYPAPASCAIAPARRRRTCRSRAGPSTGSRSSPSRTATGSTSAG
jgi:hypothetical protein